MTNQSDNCPLVSAVIPTRNRPELVCRAVRCALNQTYTNLEVVVVVDGPDPATVAALEALNNPRVNVVALEQNVGASEARNIGVRQAKGLWIAFLDDDDEWLPEKTKKQLTVAHSYAEGNILVSCKYINRDGVYDVVLPPSIPGPHEDISEYLFCRCPVFGARLGFLQTSTWLIFREYLLSVPFLPGLKANQDTDWLLRAVKADSKYKILFVDEPLAIFSNEKQRQRVGTSVSTGSLDWRYTLNWALENQRLFTRKSFAYFLIYICCGHALSQGKLRVAMREVIPSIWRQCFSSPWLILLASKYCALTCFPAGRVRSAMGRLTYMVSMRRYSATRIPHELLTTLQPENIEHGLRTRRSQPSPEYSDNRLYQKEEVRR